MFSADVFHKASSFQHAKGRMMCQYQPFAEKSVGMAWSKKMQKGGTYWVQPPGQAGTGRGRPNTDHGSAQKGWARSLGKNNPERMPHPWAWDYRCRAVQLWGTLGSALSALSFDHHLCLFSALERHSSGALLHPQRQFLPGEGQRLINYISRFCLYK